MDNIWHNNQSRARQQAVTYSILAPLADARGSDWFVGFALYA
jgi:hypothetical protein